MTKSNLPRVLLVALAVCGSAQAALIDRAGGMVYDTVLDLTWLRDANYSVTSGLLSTGRSPWLEASQWAAELNYGGHTGWRLPTTLVPDPSCSGYYGDPNRGTHCKGSELGELFYTEGGLSAGQSILTSAILQSHFVNMQAVYWSDTEHAPGNSYAWSFITIGNDAPLLPSGYQGYVAKINYYYSAWAVHPGDIAGGPAPVPEPSTAAFFLVGLALLGLGAMRRSAR
jgi:hypothetical protein